MAKILYRQTPYKKCTKAWAKKQRPSFRMAVGDISPFKPRAPWVALATLFFLTTVALGLARFL